MKILVDEHIPLMTVQALRLLSHDVRDIRGTPDQGMQDDALWMMAQREGRLLITTDKGFTQYRVVLEKSNRGHPASRAGTNSSFTRCCISWRLRGSGCTGYQI
jgi:uncharacterized protein with PIN domain